jgi:hypothetical protein
MAEYYHLLDGSHRPLMSTDLIGRMYRQLDEAFQKTTDPAVHARLHDLALYTRYVELYSQYSQANGAERQAAFEEVMRYAWRIGGTQMIHSLGFYRDLPRRDKSVTLPAEASYRVSGTKNTWKSSEPFTDEQVQKFIKDGIANNPLIDFKAVSFSQDLVPATPLQLVGKTAGRFDSSRNRLTLYTCVEKAPASIDLQVTTGFGHDNRGGADVSLYSAAETEGAAIAEKQVDPDKQKHEVQLTTTFSGLHRIDLYDRNSITEITWPKGTPMVVESGLEKTPRFTGRWMMYFYVPKGTQVVGGYCNAQGKVLDADGKLVKQFSADDRKAYWSVPVEPGQDGKLWTLSEIGGQVQLMTVPPYLARSADEMLLPAEVVKADAAR